MHYLSNKDLIDLLSPIELIAELEEGLRDFARGEAVVPTRQHVDFDGNTLLTMPAIGKSEFGVKVVSVVPSNGSRGQPVTNGLMTLSDGATGMPLAVLDAAMLTAQRTGAVGAIGLKYTAPLDTDRIGIVGVGVQGTWQAIFACAVREIRTVYFVASSNEKAKRFVTAVARYAPRVQFSQCVDARELLVNAPVLIAATTASDPVLPADYKLLEKRHFFSIGSFKPSMTELPSLVYELAQHVVVDSDTAKFECGDLAGPLSLGLLREENLVHVADLVVGKKSVDTRCTTVFKSVGMALYDLYAARAFVAAAHRLRRGTTLYT